MSAREIVLSLRMPVSSFNRSLLGLMRGKCNASITATDFAFALRSGLMQTADIVIFTATPWTYGPSWGWGLTGSLDAWTDSGEWAARISLPRD